MAVGPHDPWNEARLLRGIAQDRRGGGLPRPRSPFSSSPPAAGMPPHEGPAGRLVQPSGKPGCIHRTGVNQCARGRAITSPQDIAISPDGRHAYVAAYGSHAVSVFERDASSGALSQLPGRRGCVSHGRAGTCAAGRALGRPSAVAVSPDGRNVYVAASASRALAVFARNRRTGTLRQLGGAAGCISQFPEGGCTDGRALNEPVAVAVSSDGSRVLVASRRSPSGVAVLSASRRRHGHPGRRHGRLHQPRRLRRLRPRASPALPGGCRGQPGRPQRARRKLGQPGRRKPAHGSRGAVAAGRAGGLHLQRRRGRLRRRPPSARARRACAGPRRPLALRGVVGQRCRGRRAPKPEHGRAEPGSGKAGLCQPVRSRWALRRGPHARRGLERRRQSRRREPLHRLRPRSTGWA